MRLALAEVCREPETALLERLAALALGERKSPIALAWQLHRAEHALPIPGTTSTQHLKENLAAAHISLTPDEVDAIAALAPEEH